MKLLEMKNWQLQASEEIWGLLPFAKILKRDKTKDKTTANKELLFIYFFCDVKSDYTTITDESERVSEIAKDIGLPEDWKPDNHVFHAIDIYNKRSQTVIQKLYKQTLKAASDVGYYLNNTKQLLDERDTNGKPVYDISKITAAIEKVPKLMKNLQEAYKEVVKEQEDNSNKKKGSKSFNVFEEGI